MSQEIIEKVDYAISNPMVCRSKASTAADLEMTACPRWFDRADQDRQTLNAHPLIHIPPVASSVLPLSNARVIKSMSRLP